MIAAIAAVTVIGSSKPADIAGCRAYLEALAAMD
jgi:hypothetical protein